MMEIIVEFRKENALMEKSAAAMPRLSTRISAIIGLALLAVFTVTLTIMGYFAVAEVEKNVHTSSDRILSVLEATHTQSMLNRGTTEDNDPAILTLDGTFQQLSENQENIKVWLVMGPKVLAFQREYGNEQEPPTDDVDNEAIISGQITARYIENRVYRLSKPVILGQGFAENPKCYTCHSNNMGIQEGEVIGLFSSAYDASDEYTAVWYQLFINALIFAGIIIGTMMIILYLIRKYIGKPLADVSTSIRQLAAGEEIALHKTTGFYELRDIYIAAEVFRNFALNKDQKIDFQKFALDEHAIVSITDVKGNITYVNDKFCAVSGYNREELIGSNHRIVKTDTQSDAFWVSMWKTIANGNTWHGDIRNQNKSGEYYWVKTTIVPSLDGDGKPTQYVGIRTEITDDKLNQTKLMAANSAKSNFLSTMSHEIRTPLNGVLGIAQLMKDTDLNEDQETQVNTILSSGQTLLAILNDVLDMSKIEAGRIELEEKVFCLSDLISTITTPFQTLSDEKGLTLVANNDLKRELAVRGDPVRLRQIIWNLLSNAIKFTEEGQVSLAISDAEATTSENASKIDLKDHLFCFTIKDTGSGIAPDRVGAIFNAFTQEDSSITQKYGGTGLGLSIVKQFAELMGGDNRSRERSWKRHNIQCAYSVYGGH